MLLGGDRLGRDLLSRIIYGARISLSIGLVGVAISFALGVVIGGISGYVGGVTDNLIRLSVGVEDLDDLIALLAKLPGLGPRSARRAVLHLIKKRSQVLIPLAEAMQKVGATARECLNCGNIGTTHSTRVLVIRDVNRAISTYSPLPDEFLC